MARLTRAESRSLNRQRLITAARECMTADGYEAAQLEVIAERAEVTTGAIYSIFGSKRKLLLAVVGEAPSLWDTAARELTDDLSVEDALAACASVVHRMCATGQEHTFELELLGLAAHDDELLGLARDRIVRDCETIARHLTGRRRLSDPAGLTRDQAWTVAVSLRSLLHGLAQHAALADIPVDEATFRTAARALAATVSTNDPRLPSDHREARGPGRREVRPRR